MSFPRGIPYTRDTEWKKMLADARRFQQDWYEMLPEWTVYSSKDYHYLKLKIALAIFGMPEQDDNSILESIECMEYTNAQKELINGVYEQICCCGKGYDDEDSISYSMVYNVFFRLKSVTAVPATETKVHQTPIFKIQKLAEVTEQGVEEYNGILYKTWYIDMYGRVYKSWEDYKSTNNMPACTMVLPHGGCYQPDIMCPITIDSSTVLLEVVTSPAACSTRKLCEAVDTGSKIASLVGIGMGVASFVLPGVGPAIAGVGFAVTTVGSAWTAGRSAQVLVDRSKHEESIRPTNRDALCAWIGIGGCVLSVASTASVTVLTNAARTGNNVSNAMRITSNAAIGGQLAVNGTGIILEGYTIYDRYQNEGEFNTGDVLLLAVNIFFFANAVVRVRTAGEIIRSTQGKIIDDFKSEISSKRMRKMFNRAQRNATSHAEVVRFAIAKQEFLPKMNLGQNSSVSAKPSIAALNFTNGKIVVNDVTLLDPIEFAMSFRIRNAAYCLSIRRDVINDVAYKSPAFMNLKTQLEQLLRNTISGIADTLSSDIVQNLKDVLEDLLDVHNSQDVLKMLFNIAVKLRSGFNPSATLIALGVQFIYMYAKRHVERRAANSADDGSELIYKIILTIAECGESLMPYLSQSFNIYRNHRS